MTKSLENPFFPSQDIKPNLTSLAEQGFLSKSDVAKLRELESQKNQSSEFGIRSSMSDVSLKEGMTAQERGSLKESQELPRKEIIDWAERNDLGDEDWVDETFDFQSDGTVVCNGDLNLFELTEPDFPKYIVEVTGYLNLYNLTSAEDLKLPTTIGGGLHLNNLTSAEDLKLPTTIGGGLHLNSLTSAEHLKFPTIIGGDLDLNSLASAEHIEFPTTIGGDLNLFSLTSAEDLKLPITIGGDLYLNNLTSAEHLELPTTIGGNLNLNSLISAEHLELTDIAGTVFLRRLSEEKKQQLREKYLNLTIK